MFCINVILTAKNDADVPKIRELLSEAARLSREEPGCVRFEVCHSSSNPAIFILCERWETEDAWKTHREEKAFQEIYKPKVMPLVERTPHICELI